MQLKKNGENLKDLMNTDILPCARAGDFQFWVTTAMQVLEKHSNGMPRARVFAHALWGLAKSASEWDELQPWIEDGLSPQLYSEMAPLFVRETPAPSPGKATAESAPAQSRRTTTPSSHAATVVGEVEVRSSSYNSAMVRQ
jgi:hypothetical protein